MQFTLTVHQNEEKKLVKVNLKTKKFLILQIFSYKLSSFGKQTMKTLFCFAKLDYETKMLFILISFIFHEFMDYYNFFHIKENHDINEMYSIVQ